MPTTANGDPSLTPYLVVRGAARAIDFYKHAFGAREDLRVAGPRREVHRPRGDPDRGLVGDAHG